MSRRGRLRICRKKASWYGGVRAESLGEYECECTETAVCYARMHKKQAQDAIQQLAAWDFEQTEDVDVC